MPSAQQKVVQKPAETHSKQQQQQQKESTPKDSSLTRSNSIVKQASAAGSGEKTPQELPEFIKQALATIEKKVRNLEKRRSKLDEYKDLQNKGTVLNNDQLSAVSKYEEVTTCLDLVKDLDKQLNGFAADALKAQRKQAKKEQMEREELVRERQREVGRLQALLNAFGGDKVRQDFLSGKFGENPQAQAELDLLDSFDKLVTVELSKSYDNLVNESVDHLLSLAEAKNKPVLNTTYAELRRLFERIQQSSYWNGEVEQVVEQVAAAAPVVEIPQQQAVEQSNEQDLHQQQKSSNVNTSTDDFVVVTNNEIKELEQEHQQHQELVEQGQDQNTFFSTLNRPDHSIKQILNDNNEGLNFLQDSQIYPQEQQQQQNYQQQQEGDFEYAGKRDANGYRNNGGNGGYRRSYHNNGGDNGNGDQRRSVGGGRGGGAPYQGGRGGGRGGSRGGFNNGGRGGQGGQRPQSFRGGRPAGFSREAGQQQQPQQQS